MRWVFLAVFAAVVLVLSPAAAAASTRSHDQLPLHVGSAGPKVCELKYLLREPAPRQNAFHAHVKGIYKGPLCSTNPAVGYLGKPFATKILYWYKYRLGWPRRFNNPRHPVAGQYFFNVVTGHKNRTKEMVALAARRLRSAAIEPGVTPLAAKMRVIALSQVGVYEIPPHSNRGPRISYPVGSVPSYQSATGQYGAAWCMSFAQWLLKRVGYGTVANRTAGVFYFEGYERYHGHLASKVKVGSFVAFLDDGGHIGFVVKVLASGYVTVEGNWNDQVAEVYHRWSDRLRVFINLPRIA